MNTFWLFPPLGARDTSPRPEKKRPARGLDIHRTNAKRIYDHEAMLRDRMTGMGWLEIAQKHHVTGRTPRKRAERAMQLVTHSNAAKRLTPEQVLALSQFSQRRWRAT